MGAFDELFLTFHEWGLTEALLPFLLVFVLVFATLERTKVIGNGEKKYNVVVAFIFGFLVVVPHLTGSYPPEQDIVLIINNALPNISLIIVAIVTLLLLLGLFSPAQVAGTGLGTILAIVSIVAVIFFFGQAAGWFGAFPTVGGLNLLNDPDTQALVIILLVFGAVLWFITRDEGGGASIGGPLGGFFNGLRNAITPK